MKAKTIGDFLTDFQDRPPRVRPAEPASFAKPVFLHTRTRPKDAPPRKFALISSEPSAQPQAQPQPQQQAEEARRIIEEAYERGKKDGRAAAEAQFEERLAEEKARLAVQLGLDRYRWTAEQGKVMADRIATTVRELEDGISETLARILLPFLEGAVREKALAAFAAQLSALIADGSRPILQISGPADLLDVLKERLAAVPAAIEYVPAEAPGGDPARAVEVRVMAGQTVIETQMRAWAERLNDALR